LVLVFEFGLYVIKNAKLQNFPIPFAKKPQECSRNVIYGRYNRGTITMPQERRYILEVDSSTLVVKNWK
jgi:hypothetical protein